MELLAQESTNGRLAYDSGRPCSCRTARCGRGRQRYEPPARGRGWLDDDPDLRKRLRKRLALAISRAYVRADVEVWLSWHLEDELNSRGLPIAAERHGMSRPHEGRRVQVRRHDKELRKVMAQYEAVHGMATV